MLSLEEATQVMNGSAELNDDGSVVAKTDSPEVKNEEPKTEVTETPSDKGNSEDEPDKDEPKEEPKEENKIPSKVPNKQKFTKDERTRHAFAEMKAKQKAYKQQIAERDAKIKELEAKLSGNPKSKDDYKDVDEYVDDRANRIADQRELERLKGEQEIANNEQAKEEYSRWVASSFSDERELDDFKNLCEIAQKDYRKIAPEMGVDSFGELLADAPNINQYLSDSENGAAMLRHFIRKPQRLMEIKEIRNPFKQYNALQDMERRMVAFFNSKKNPPKQTNEQAVPPVKKALPSTGRLTKSESVNEEATKFDHPWTEAEAIAYLKRKK